MEAAQAHAVTLQQLAAIPTAAAEIRVPVRLQGMHMLVMAPFLRLWQTCDNAPDSDCNPS